MDTELLSFIETLKERSPQTRLSLEIEGIFGIPPDL